MTATRTKTIEQVWGENNPGNVIKPSFDTIQQGYTPIKPPVQEFNWIVNLLSGIMKSNEEYGILPWNAATAYKAGAFCLGSNTDLYKSNQGNTAVDPVSDLTGTWSNYADLITSQTAQYLPNWDATIQYSQNNIVGGNDGNIYVSITSNNIGNPVTDALKWTKITLSQIAQNLTNTITNAGAITDIEDDVTINTGNIATNASNISTNTSNIQTNTNQVSINTGNIFTNASNLSTNIVNTDNNTGNFTNHISGANPHPQYSRIIEDFTSHKATPGFQKLPNGLMLQWGTGPLHTSGADQEYFLNFYTTFPNGIITVICGSKTTGAFASDAWIHKMTQSTSNFSYALAWNGNYILHDGVACEYLAIGY